MTDPVRFISTANDLQLIPILHSTIEMKLFFQSCLNKTTYIYTTQNNLAVGQKQVKIPNLP